MLIALLFSAQLLAPDLPRTVAGGDEAFSRIDYPAAVAIYEEGLSENRNEPELLWRIARAYVCMAEVASPDSQQAFLHSAEQYSRNCVRIDPRNPEGHTWLAAALGYIALGAPSAEQVRLSWEILHETDTALAQNPNNDAAYSIRGSFYRGLGNVGWLRKSLAHLFVGNVPDGGFEEAEAALKRAVELAPGIMRHSYELGVLYLDIGRKEEAARWLGHAATLPVLVGIDRPRLQKIRELLRGLHSDAE